MCQCTKNGSSDCNADVLGPVYPGQRLQLELWTPCNDEPLTLYAEINSIHLPDSACKVAPQTDINTISNYSKKFAFIIVSVATNVCELFLIAFQTLNPLLKYFMFNYLLVQLDLHYKVEHAVAILFYHLILMDVTLIIHPLVAIKIHTWITTHTQAIIIYHWNEELYCTQ